MGRPAQHSPTTKRPNTMWPDGLRVVSCWHYGLRSQPNTNTRPFFRAKLARWHDEGTMGYLSRASPQHDTRMAAAGGGGGQRRIPHTKEVAGERFPRSTKLTRTRGEEEEAADPWISPATEGRKKRPPAHGSHPQRRGERGSIRGGGGDDSARR
jgi:hypothetical protein